MPPPKKPQPVKPKDQKADEARRLRLQHARKFMERYRETLDLLAKS